MGDQRWVLFFKILKYFILLTQRGDTLDQSCRHLGKDWSFLHASLLRHKHSALGVAFVLSELQTSIVFTKA